MHPGSYTLSPMIDLKQLRENPDRFRDGAAKKQIPVDIDRIIDLDAQRRAALSEQEALRAEQKKLAKETGPKIGQLAAQLKNAEGDEKTRLQAEIEKIKAAPAALKTQIQALEETIVSITPRLDALLLAVPLPPDPDVPAGRSADDNVELRRWAPNGWDDNKTFEQNRGFKPRTHIELCDHLGLVDFPRGVKIAGARSYVLTGDGMRLHNAVLQYAFNFMVNDNGFKAMSVPVLVKEECMVGTGFFPGGRDQAYHIPNPKSEEDGGGPSGYDQFLTGTGEVGLMGLHQDEILEEESLPRCYTTVSTCFRREAGAAGKDTAGLYRIHQFDKVEQVVICKADEQESRDWHQKMLGYVQALLQNLGLPYRLLQCCTGDLGQKNADMIDVECWMPSRNAYGETHSASRLYDFQTRRLNLRYKATDEHGKKKTVFCHSLNNTVAASPRILIPILELYQNEDGTITVPEVLRPYMGGQEKIG